MSNHKYHNLIWQVLSKAAKALDPQDAHDLQTALDGFAKADQLESQAEELEQSSIKLIQAVLGNIEPGSTPTAPVAEAYRR